LSGLPLEFGRESLRFRQRVKPMKKLLRDVQQLPLADEVVDGIWEMLRGFSLGDAALQARGWKSQVPLRPAELTRQARLVDDLWRRKNLAAALGLMSEWTNSWAAWRLGEVNSWLEHRSSRRRVANFLGAI